MPTTARTRMVNQWRGSIERSFYDRPALRPTEMIPRSPAPAATIPRPVTPNPTTPPPSTPQQIGGAGTASMIASTVGSVAVPALANLANDNLGNPIRKLLGKQPLTPEQIDRFQADPVKELKNSNIPDAFQPKDRGEATFQPTPGQQHSFGVPVRIRFYAANSFAWRELDVVSFGIVPDPNANPMLWGPDERFHLDYTTPSGQSTSITDPNSPLGQNRPRINIKTLTVTPAPGQPAPPELQGQTPNTPFPNWQAPAAGLVGGLAAGAAAPSVAPTKPAAPTKAPPNLQPTDPDEGEQARKQPNRRVAPFPFGSPQARSGSPSNFVGNPIGGDGKLDQNKHQQWQNQQQSNQPSPDQSPAPRCQDSCVADLQLNNQSNNAMSTVMVDKFVMWNRLIGRPVYVKEPVQVPANMVPFAQLMGSRTADIRSRFGLAELRARLTQVMNVLSTAATLHNAAMLSANLGQTLGEVVTESVQTFAPMFGVDKELAETFDFNEVLGKAVNTTMENALGKEVWSGTKTTFTKLNRIVTTASQIVWTVRSMADSSREIAEWTAENTGKIGNALKRFRVVGENAYSWMPERVTGQGRWEQRIQRFRDGTESIDDAASSLSSVVSEVRSITEEVNELKEQKENFDKALKEATPNNRPDNDATKNAATQSNTASKSPELQASDRAKGDE